MLTCHRSAEERRMRDMEIAALTDLRLEGKLCDVVLKVGGVEFKVHKIILCGCSQYFRTLFTGTWVTDKQMYTIPGVSPEMMFLIINYAYTHSVPVTEDNLLEVLATADQFLISGIVQTCCFFLENRLCLMNCLNTWQLTDMYYLPELRHKVFQYILLHFEQILGVSHEVLELSVQQLAAIIEDDRLNVKREDTVFETILRWVNNQPDQRRGHIPELLAKVRLCLMDTYYLQNAVMDNAVIKDSKECRPIINNALKAIVDFRIGCSTSVYSNLLTRPRLPSTILLATGGGNENNAATIKAYDVKADRWVTVTTGGIPRFHFATAVLNNCVYLIGGFRHEVNFNTVQKFDLITRTWHNVAPMISQRFHLSVAVQNGCIYAIGGFNGHTYFNTVECYHPETDQWTRTAPMRSKRCKASATTLHGKVYICGGFNGNRNLSTAECYDPNTNLWTAVTPMRCSRSGLGIIAYRGCIYAVGGTLQRSTHLCSVEVYNPRSYRWSAAAAMSIPRCYFGIEVVDDQLFVVGGFNGSPSMLATERYDEDTGMWYRASSPEMPGRSLRCCVLPGLHGMAENLFPRGPLMPPNVEEVAGGST